MSFHLVTEACTCPRTGSLRSHTRRCSFDIHTSLHIGRKSLYTCLYRGPCTCPYTRLHACLSAGNSRWSEARSCAGKVSWVRCRHSCRHTSDRVGAYLRARAHMHASPVSACMCVHGHVRAHACMHAHLGARAFVHACIPACTHARVCGRMRVDKRVLVPARAQVENMCAVTCPWRRSVRRPPSRPCRRPIRWRPRRRRRRPLRRCASWCHRRQLRRRDRWRHRRRLCRPNRWPA